MIPAPPINSLIKFLFLPAALSRLLSDLRPFLGGQFLSPSLAPYQSPWPRATALGSLPSFGSGKGSPSNKPSPMPVGHKKARINTSILQTDPLPNFNWRSPILRSIVRYTFVSSLGADNKVVAWNLTGAWADYKMTGPILFPEDHRATLEDKPFRLFFTDVAVKLGGSNDFVAAK